MKNLVALLSITLLTLLLGCQSKTSIWYVYHQTQCADPWEIPRPETDEQLIYLVTNYLRKKGVSITAIDIQFSPRVTCRGCECPTGRRIYVIPSNPIMKFTLIAEGFVEN